jgi:predicted permease
MVMPGLRTLWQKLRRIFRSSSPDPDFEEETRIHLAMLAERLERQGLAPETARSEARRQFGNTTSLHEARREMQTFGSVERFCQDLRYAARLLRLNPVFALAAVASLGFGIGANTAIFQLIDAVRLRSLPVRNPNELARVAIAGGNHGMGLNNAYGDLTRPIWEELRERQQVFSGMFAWGVGQEVVSRGGRLEPINGLYVTGELFRVLGVEAWRGRLVLPEDEHACPATTAVVSYSYWQTKMGGREIDTGAKLLIDGQIVQVIGVSPPQFLGLVVGDHFDVALPLCRPQQLLRNLFDVTVMGRLRPGVSLQSASAELSALSPGIMAATTPTGYNPDFIGRYRAFRLTAYPAGVGVSALREEYDSSLSLLLATTGLVLLIACANLANLILARALARERELGVRLALGATRGRLLRQLLAENVLLAAIGAVVGISIAQVVSHSIVQSLSTQSWSVSLPTGIDWRVLAFTAGVATVTCLSFGLIPALGAAGIQPLSALRAGSRGLTPSPTRAAIQRVLVIAQISVSLVLLVGAFLFVRSFHNLMTFDPGIREEGVTAAFIGFVQSDIPKERYLDFQKQLVDEIREAPGVLSAAETTNPPLLGGSWTHGIHIGAADGTSTFTWVGPEYFKTMGIPILRGRGLSSTDTANSARVAVVNETFVRQFLGGANPIGLPLRTSPEPNYPSNVYTIVGVIPDTKYNCLRCGIPPMTFASASQFPAPHPWTAIMIHSNLPSDAIANEVGRLLANKHPEMSVQLSSFQGLIRDGLVRDRLMALLSGLFGLLAAVLAAVGLYGVIAYTVAQRRHEIGVRIALGADRSQVIAMVTRQAARMVLAGVFLGVAMAVLAGRAVGTLLFGLKPYDPVTVAGAAGLLIGIGFVASLLPAHRASKLDAMRALRCD